MTVTYEEVIEFLQGYAEFDPATVSRDTRLKQDLGIDSLGFIMMVDEAEHKFQITITDDEMMAIHTIGDILSCLDKKNQ